MAMLAGPRRKQKVINLRAKNNAWSNDTGKFGQRMLEKMGWSSGKGLGAKENGIVEHVVARYKNDEKGLGFEDKNDQWTKHEDDFNSLLANLSNGDNNEDKLHSGVSLEHKSKKSKARVHYHKFTRGKDLTRYSEKDLANIFGKRSLKVEKIESKVETSIKDTGSTETEQVFTEKGSMEDYFKNKLAALKSKNQNIHYDPIEKDDYEPDYGFQGFAGTDEIEDSAFQNTEELITEDLTVEVKKNKKQKKSKELSEENVPEDENVQSDSHQVKKKKSKKNKRETDSVIIEEGSEQPKKKKSKMPPQKDEVVEECVLEEDYVPKKKKKRKNKEF